MAGAQVSLLLRMTPRYLAWYFHGIVVLLIFRKFMAGSFLRVKMTASNDGMNDCVAFACFCAFYTFEGFVVICGCVVMGLVSEALNKWFFGIVFVPVNSDVFDDSNLFNLTLSSVHVRGSRAWTLILAIILLV